MVDVGLLNSTRGAARGLNVQEHVAGRQLLGVSVLDEIMLLVNPADGTASAPDRVASKLQSVAADMFGSLCESMKLDADSEGARREPVSVLGQKNIVSSMILVYEGVMSAINAVVSTVVSVHAAREVRQPSSSLEWLREMSTGALDVPTTFGAHTDAPGLDVGIDASTVWDGSDISCVGPDASRSAGGARVGAGDGVSRLAATMELASVLERVADGAVKPLSRSGFVLDSARVMTHGVMVGDADIVNTALTVLLPFLRLCCTVCAGIDAAQRRAVRSVTDHCASVGGTGLHVLAAGRALADAVGLCDVVNIMMHVIRKHVHVLLQTLDQSSVISMGMLEAASCVARMISWAMGHAQHLYCVAEDALGLQDFVGQTGRGKASGSRTAGASQHEEAIRKVANQSAELCELVLPVFVSPMIRMLDRLRSSAVTLETVGPTVHLERIACEWIYGNIDDVCAVEETADGRLSGRHQDSIRLCYGRDAFQSRILRIGRRIRYSTLCFLQAIGVMSLRLSAAHPSSIAWDSLANDNQQESGGSDAAGGKSHYARGYQTPSDRGTNIGVAQSPYAGEAASRDAGRPAEAMVPRVFVHLITGNDVVLGSENGWNSTVQREESSNVSTMDAMTPLRYMLRAQGRHERGAEPALVDDHDGTPHRGMDAAGNRARRSSDVLVVLKLLQSSCAPLFSPILNTNVGQTEDGALERDFFMLGGTMKCFPISWLVHFISAVYRESCIVGEEFQRCTVARARLVSGVIAPHKESRVGSTILGTVVRGDASSVLKQLAWDVHFGSSSARGPLPVQQSLTRYVLAGCWSLKSLYSRFVHGAAGGRRPYSSRFLMRPAVSDVTLAAQCSRYPPSAMIGGAGVGLGCGDASEWRASEHHLCGRSARAIAERLQVLTTGLAQLSSQLEMALTILFIHLQLFARDSASRATGTAHAAGDSGGRRRIFSSPVSARAFWQNLGAVLHPVLERILNDAEVPHTAGATPKPRGYKRKMRCSIVSPYSSALLRRLAIAASQEVANAQSTQ